MTYLSSISHDQRYQQFKITESIPEFRKTYDYLNNGDVLETQHSIAGRVYNVRYASKRLIFLDIQGAHLTDASIDNNHLQIMLNKKSYHCATEFDQLKQNLHRGDIIGVTGVPTKTSRGELSVIPSKCTILAPCLHELPVALTDPKLILTKRYLDMMVNYREVIKRYKVRSQVISKMRRYMEDVLHLTEVETPILTSQASGAAAKPFKTFHNDLKKDMHLRIAPELNLKRLVVGGMGGVYEIGKQFRNEQIDPTHNPEFTSCEMYLPYHTHNDLMKITEDMICYIIDSVHSPPASGDGDDAEHSRIIQWGDVTIDWSPPFRCLDITTELTTKLGPMPSSYEGDEMRKFLDSKCTKLKFNCNEPRTTSRLLETLIEELVESQCDQPTFVTGHPRIISPLARSDPINPEITQRFELFVNHKELCNAFSELNDPIDQQKRFTKQAIAKAEGDEEACDIDEDYCRALEYGMPPTAGWGIGIDRLIMMLTNAVSIKQVLMFPSHSID